MQLQVHMQLSHELEAAQSNIKIILIFLLTLVVHRLYCTTNLLFCLKNVIITVHAHTLLVNPITPKTYS